MTLQTSGGNSIVRHDAHYPLHTHQDGLSHDGLMRRLILPLVLAASLVVSPIAVAPMAQAADAVDPAAYAAEDARIATVLAKKLGNPRLGRDVVVNVTNLTAGTTVFSQDPNAPQRPASNMKVITAVTALSQLGPDYAFRTQVLTTADPTQIYLKGGGDPMLSTKSLENLAVDTAVGRDVTVPITVHVDASLFPAPTNAPGWTSGYTPYVVAPVRALARLYDYSKDTTSNAADVYIKKLRSLGFTVSRGEDVVTPADATLVAENAKHTVASAVRLMLLDSENNVAEALFRQVAVKRGLPADWAGSKQAAEDSLRELGVDPAGLAIYDGSGVSRRDRLTASALTQLIALTTVGDPARFAEMYAERSMPVSGQTGTLKAGYGRYVTKASKCAVGKVRAKTGTLFDTITLSGVTSSDDGAQRAFSIMVNKRPAKYSKLATRQAVDALVATITGCR
jgi:D-alanyl-D-alanine carboxypeptidase/D-alanyl-D-alanine-endopeptidase (penicillin-binding protein 4)